MQQGIKKLQWFEYFKVVFLEILNAGLCRVFANQVTYIIEVFVIFDVYILAFNNESNPPELAAILYPLQ